VNALAVRKPRGGRTPQTRVSPQEQRPQVSRRRARIKATPRVAIVDDHPDVAETLAVLVNGWLGYEAQSFMSGADFLASLDRGHPDAILLDLWMPAPDGREVMRELRKRGCADIPVIIVSAAGDQALTAAVAAGAVAALRKPVERGELESALKRALRQKR
jgi:CheY-like chemotaxis protein